jgi:hypothetical protein
MTITPISTRGSESPEAAAHQTASRELLPLPAGDDFGLLRALPLAIAGGLAFWGALVWCLL